MIAREVKTTSWEEDRRIARQIARELNPILRHADAFINVVRSHTAPRVETTSCPPQPLVDGYGSREIWLRSELALLKAEEEWIHDGKMLRTDEVSAIGEMVVLKTTAFYLESEGRVHEQKKIRLMFVYNGSICGSITAQDVLPPEWQQRIELVVSSALNDCPEDKPEQDQTWPYYTLEPLKSLEADVAAAKKFAVKLNELYYRPDEMDAFMHANVAEKTMTVHYPPVAGRDGYGSREFWLRVEYATRVISKNNIAKRSYVKHEDFFTVGSFIFLDEDRVYPTPEGTLYYLHCISVMPVLNEKMIGFQAFLEPYPAFLSQGKQELFDRELSELKDEGELDTSMLPHLQKL